MYMFSSIRLHILLLVYYNLHMREDYEPVDGYYHWERHAWAFVAQNLKSLSTNERQVFIFYLSFS